MERLHPEAIWYKSQLRLPEEEEAAALLKQATDNPLSLGKSARRLDTRLLETMAPKGTATTQVKVEIPEPEVSSSQSDRPTSKVEEKESVSTDPVDIEFPTSSAPDRHDPPQLEGGHSYAFRSEVAQQIFGGPVIAMRFRTGGSDPKDEEETEDPDAKKARRE